MGVMRSVEGGDTQGRSNLPTATRCIAYRVAPRANRNIKEEGPYYEVIPN